MEDSASRSSLAFSALQNQADEEREKRKLKGSLANPPFDVASLIAEYVYDWENDPIAAVKLLDKIKPEGKGRGKRDRAYTLRSLTLLSRDAYSFWLPFLLRHVRLETQHLHCLLRVLKRNPRALEDLRELILIDDPSRMRELNQKEKDEADKKWLREKQHCIPPSDSTLSSDQKVVKEILRLESANSLIGLDELLKPHDFKPNNDEPENSIKDLFLASSYCSTAAGIILDSAINLKSFSVLGETLFPLAKRSFELGKTLNHAFPLKGLETLKKIKIEFTEDEYQPICLTAANVIWIMSLPCLEESSLASRFHSQDIKFLKKHSVGWKGFNNNNDNKNQRFSNIKDFILKIHFEKEDVNVDKKMKIWTAKNKRDALKNLLIYTKDLKRFGLQIFDSSHGMLSNSLFSLENSFRTIEILELKGLFLSSDPTTFTILNRFSKLKDFGFDTLFIQEFEKTFHLEGYGFRNRSVFGDSTPLECIRLLGSVQYLGDVNGSIVNSEGGLAQLIENYPKILPLKRLITYTNPTVFFTMKTATELLEDHRWLKGRRELVKACRNKDIEMIFV